MSRPRNPLDTDLAVVAVLALLGLLVTAIPFLDWLDTLLYLPLVLVVPGYALTAAIFPPGFITPNERTILSVVFSISAWALGGLVLQVAFGLNGGIWLAMLLILTVATVGVAQARRGTPAPAARQPLIPLLDPRAAGMLLAAAVVCGVAIAASSSGAERQLDKSRFSSVWIVSSDDSNVSTSVTVDVGVGNHEGSPTRYRLRISRGGQTIRKWRLRLKADEAWQAGVHLRSEGLRPLVATLFRGGTLYRRVALSLAREP